MPINLYDLAVVFLLPKLYYSFFSTDKLSQKAEIHDFVNGAINIIASEWF